MLLTKKPVNGMRDILPGEMEIREYVLSVIRKTYCEYGFSVMETPVVERIENLLSKQGGDNEKLIFKILKRGEKLRVDAAAGEAELTDCGLRYDLTLPLSRYYANHANELPSPFKALQMGPVFRADRPQRGRYRQFMQCDIDILGDASYLAEVELLSASTSVLSRLGFTGFTVRVNDRRILKDTAKAAGFAEELYEKVFIILDKLDKIGREGVRAELAQLDTAEKADACLSLFENAEPAYELPKILSAAEALKEGDFRLVFDPTLVRGMSYYTGPIFEISVGEFGGSVGGGGRYDGMIGRFTGQNVPACGFSIGFERLILLLAERGFSVPERGEKTALLLGKNLSDEKVGEALSEAKRLRAQGGCATVCTMKKNRKFQREQLEREGYTTIKEYFNG